MKQLAIIIPAYKATFLDAALASIAAQTCQDFTLYIGDDCSPYDIKGIVDRYRDKIDLVYTRFDTNLGGKDLVAQWERCINMSHDEPWLWLFSDDDVMEQRCVEEFYKAKDETKSKYDVYHFNVKKINKDGKIISIPCKYPILLKSYHFYQGKLNGRYASLVVENIFSRIVYQKKQGFVNFDLAWGSDTATWINFSEEKGLYTIPSAYVHWRISDQNISPDRSPQIVKRKVSALLAFFSWTYKHFENYRLGCFIINSRGFISRMGDFCKYQSKSENDKAILLFCKIHHCQFLYPIFKMFIKLKKC